MAQRTPPPEDRSSLQVIWVNLNGANTTVQEALRTIDNMIRRPVIPAKSQPALPKKPAKGANGKEGAEQPEEEAGLFTGDAEQAEVDGEVVDVDQSPPPPKPARTTRLPKGIPDLDLSSATPTFRDFATEKQPKDQFDWYLLVASWMKKHKQVEEISLRHVVTAKQVIGADWPTLPADPGQPFRDGRRATLGIFVKGSKHGLSKITATGEDRVARMGQKNDAR